MNQKNGETDVKSYFDVEVAQLGRMAKSLPEMVAEQLLAAITDGTLPPGEHLKEELCSVRFGVSRSTVREAIAILERRGVVSRIARQGARVLVVDAAEIEEIFHIRAQLLGLAARLTAERAPDSVLSAFAQQVTRLEALAVAPMTSPSEYAAASIEAQRQLVSTGTGKRLQAIYEDLSSAALWRFAVRDKAISFQTMERRMESARDWRQVGNAIMHRNGDAAEVHAKALLLASYRAIKDRV
jgi:DNA-binding GntR family transcriptional regulator